MKIAIIGAGMTGLVSGYRLVQKGHRVTIFEKSGEVGGLLAGFKIEGQGLEKAYHHIFKTDKYIISLIEELGLGKKLRWLPGSTAIYFDNKVWPFNGALDLLKFGPLSFMDKLRMGLVKIYLEKENNFSKFENVLAYQWMEKWCGKRGYRVVWEPLLKNKFSNRYKDVSMAWLWARIHTRANSSEKGGEKLGYMDGGFQQVTNKLADLIKKKSGEILLNKQPSDDELKKFDAVISSAPLKEVDYLGAVIVVFSSSQNLSKFYWHNINDTRSPFVAMVQHTNLVDKKNYRGKHIYYLGAYLPQDHKYFASEDKTIINDYFDYLKKIFPDFEEKQVSEKHVFKFKYAQHIVTRNYKIKPSRGRIINVNFARIYPEDRGINFAVREGEGVTDKL